jgi:hypothetical protein
VAVSVAGTVAVGAIAVGVAEGLGAVVCAAMPDAVMSPPSPCELLEQAKTDRERTQSRRLQQVDNRMSHFMGGSISGDGMIIQRESYHSGVRG